MKDIAGSKIGWFLAMALLAVGLWSWASKAEGKRAAGPPRYNFEIQVVPKDASRTMFVATANLYDMDGGETLMAPRMEMPSGEEASASTQAVGSDTVYRLSVKADAQTESALYHLTVTEKGSPVLILKGTIYLKPKG